jgi:hypothetical protein
MSDFVEIPTLLPARMLNEFVYCPRLFYLEWVDDRRAASVDTAQGDRAHRRVDLTSASFRARRTRTFSDAPPPCAGPRNGSAWSRSLIAWTLPMDGSSRST